MSKFAGQFFKFTTQQFAGARLGDGVDEGHSAAQFLVGTHYTCKTNIVILLEMKVAAANQTKRVQLPLCDLFLFCKVSSKKHVRSSG